MLRAPRIVLLLSTPLIFWTGCGDEAPTGSLPDTGFINVPDSGAVNHPTDGGDEEKGRAEVSATTLDFGTAIQGTTVSRTLTVTNNGAIPARVALGELTGPQASAYTVGAFVPQTLAAAGGSASVEITLNAAEIGAAFANILVYTCDDGCPIAVSLLGTVATTGIVCPGMLEAGTVLPGACATSRLTCMNTGNRPESILSAELDRLSDPQFALNTTTFPLNIDAGGSGDLEITFCPDAAGDFFARLLVAEQTVEVSGHGGGVGLECTPRTLDFGMVPVDGSTQRELTCTNVGFDPVFITDVIFSSGDYRSNAVLAEIGVGQTVTFTVVIAPIASGARNGTMTIHSNDPDNPELRIDLIATAVQLGECAATLLPAVTDLGLVALGDARSGVVTLMNTGGDLCLIDSVDAPAIGGFSFTALPVSGDGLDPGETAELAYVFAPTAAGTSSVTIGVHFLNLTTAPVSALIQGTGGTVNLNVVPGALDFGAVAFGCASATTQNLRLQNTGRTPVLITQIELVTTTSSGFSLVNPPAVPLTVPSLQAIDLTVAYAPIFSGTSSATLQINVFGETTPIFVAVSGRGSISNTRSDSASLSSPAYDILFMVDNSASMDLSQAALAEALPRFVAHLASSGSDFHFALITSDMIDPNHQGLFQGTPAVIDRLTPNFEDLIIARAIPGLTGDGTQEGGMGAIAAALTPPLSTAQNAGFLRPDARLVIFAITDEDDQSNTPSAVAASTLSSAAGSGGLSVFVITGPAIGNCTGPQGMASAAPDWAELVARTNGTIYSYCDPVGEDVDQMIDVLFPTGRIPLSADPVPETISVTQMGTPVPTTRWRYERVTNSVVLTATASLGNAAIDVAYEAFCLSPSCGDGALDAHESCDDGNSDDGDNCTAGCRLAICGDGFTAQGIEACDDANLNTTDACLSSCVAASCGDGFLQIGVEDCDDGNNTNNDGCPASCAFSNTLAGFYTVAPLAPLNYPPLGAETAVTLTGGNDDGFGTVAIPFAFEFFGLPINTIDVSTNGLAATAGLDLASFGNVSFPAQTAPSGIIAPWWEDLVVDNAVTGGASLAFELQGTSPDQVLVIQWRNVRLASQNSANHRRFNFQIALFETSNVIELRYGETAISGLPGTATSASVGAENQDGTIGENLLTCTPNCTGPARPGNPNGFPNASVLRLTP